MEISCCLIVLDEEKTLDRVLNCVSKFCEEIIVVDTGSRDDSKIIAQKYTDKIYDFEWADDFSKARNFAFSKASKPYLMWIDADDYIDERNIEKIRKFKNTASHFDMVYMNYATNFDENGNITFCFERERIVKNEKRFYFVDPIHEAIVPSGKILHLDITIEHRKEKKSDAKRNLLLYQKLIKKGISFNPRMRFYYANELYYNHLFKDAIIQYDIFLKQNGFVENSIQACLNSSICYHSLQNKYMAYKMLYESFVYDVPRSEICCQIGFYLCQDRKYKEAIFWYKRAIQKPNLRLGAFVLRDCYDFLPYYNIAFCEYNLGHYKRAVQNIVKAMNLKPNNIDVKRNFEYYTKLANKTS